LCPAGKSRRVFSCPAGLGETAMPARDIEQQVEEGMRFARSSGTIVQLSGLGKLQRADPRLAGIGLLVRRSG